MMLLIFTFYMLRYFGKKAFAASLFVVIVFSMPRIMSGAHWLTDVVVGSGSICSIVLSWMLLTPASDRIIALFDRYLPHQDKAKTKNESCFSSAVHEAALLFAGYLFCSEEILCYNERKGFGKG